MTKALGSRTAYIGRSGYLHRLFSVAAANGSLIGLFFRISLDKLTDRLQRFLGDFRRESSMEDSNFPERSGNPQIEEIRNWAYLDIHRNIR